jgi:predicted RNA methylase
MTDRAELILAKYADARRRGYYRTVDLFAGCGGMSLGFERAGFRSVAAVEVDGHARATTNSTSVSWPPIRIVLTRISRRLRLRMS